MLSKCPECGRSLLDTYCHRCKMHVTVEMDSSSSLQNTEQPYQRMFRNEGFGFFPITRKTQVIRMFEFLPPRQRMCFLLRYGFNLSRKEIANMLSIHIHTVRSHLYYARKQVDPAAIPECRDIVVKQSLAWVLIKVLRYSSKEVGVMMGISPSTARQHAKREEDAIHGANKSKHNGG